MKVTFVGHNTFLVTEGATNIYFDPFLVSEPRVGHLAMVPYPERDIVNDRMPKPDAVVLSHEHADHFSLASLDHLGKGFPVYVGELMPGFIVTLLESQGYNVKRLKTGVTNSIGEVSIDIFYPNEVAFWESRVSQVLVRSDSCPRGLFFAVDAPVTDKLLQIFSSRKLPIPLVVAVSNNTQVSTPTQPGALESERATYVPERDGLVALQIFQDLLQSGARVLNKVPHILIVGGGFVKEGDFPSPSPYSSQEELLKAMRPLLPGHEIFGPGPGSVFLLSDVLAVDENADWIQLEKYKEKDTRNKKIITSYSTGLKLSRASDQADEVEMFAFVQQWLNSSLPELLMTPFGKELLRHAYGIDSKRRAKIPFLVSFELNTGHTVSLALNCMEGGYVTADREASGSQSIPFGLCVPLIDFYAVLKGRAQIWDLAAISIKQWFSGGQLVSPMAALYTMLGEIVRPDLALPTYSSH